MRGPRPVKDAIWAGQSGCDPVYLRNRAVAFDHIAGVVDDVRVNPDYWKGPLSDPDGRLVGWLDGCAHVGCCEALALQGDAVDLESDHDARAVAAGDVVVECRLDFDAIPERALAQIAQ